MSGQDALTWFVDLSLRWKIVAVATIVVLIELAFRYLAPRSRAYAGWTRFFQGIGAVWTAVLLAIVYVVSVGPIGLVQRLFGRDPLDRRLAPEPTFWRPHEPNPLGPAKAARHQF
ncbi:MAG: SxtJ family membrane protein [Acidobacteria bacterium]|nr:SxtJ family membrane protein [Acidobacteriota bacterium]